MINKVIKYGAGIFKLSLSKRAYFLVAILAIVFFNFSPGSSHAQYTQVNNGYGGMYTYVNNYNELEITTTAALNITSSSVTLTGEVNGRELYNTYNLETWFQYGKNTGLGYSTVHTPSNGGYANYQANLGNLEGNTVYYFRAVAQTPQGVLYGNTNAFRTDFPVVINKVENNTENNAVVTAPVAPKETTRVSVNSETKSSAQNVDTKEVEKVLPASPLPASASLSGSFLPGNVLGWLVLIVLGLFLVAGVQHLYRKSSGNTMGSKHA